MLEQINQWFNNHEAMSNVFATFSLGIMGGCITWFYSKNSKKLSEDQIFHDLFRDFNERYGKINGDLERLEVLSKKKNGYSLDRLMENDKLLDSVMDFFNLCAEEYYWWKKGRISDEVWAAWREGMNYWYTNIQAIKDLWETEMSKGKSESYYLVKNHQLFK